MSELSAPKNLTRNVLIGMAAGVAVASAFYYGQSVQPQSQIQFIWAFKTMFLI